MMKKLESIDDLKPAPYNPREIEDGALAALGVSVREFGDLSGIVWNSRSGHLVAGHQRVKALQAADAPFFVNMSPAGGKGQGPGFMAHNEWFPVRVVDWDETTERAANVSANNPHIAGRFTVDLADILDGLKVDLPTFEDLNLDDLFTDVPLPEPVAGLTDPDDVPEPPEEPVSRTGDLWLCGGHRVLCGDSTSEADLAQLCPNGKTVGLVFTSPPYAQQRDYGEASDVSDWDGLMCGVFGNLPAGEKTQVLVNLGLVHREGEWVPYWDAWVGWMREQGWRRFGWYVWDQGFGLPGDWNGRFAPSHEWVFHFNHKGVRPETWTDKQPENIKPRQQGASTMRKKDGNTVQFSNPGASAQPTKVPDSVLRIGRQVGTDGHPAQFPQALPATMLLSWPGSVFDPFLGSGTTMIAAEQLKRKCYGIEIEPRYVDVAVRRWQEFTGNDATLEGDGRTFAEIAEERKHE